MTAQMRASWANPAVRDRVNLVNGLLCNAAGERRLLIDPRCKELILNLERVSWVRDAQGRLRRSWPSRMLSGRMRAMLWGITWRRLLR